MTTVGSRIRSAIEASKIRKQDALAKQMGVHRVTVNKWCTGKGSPGEPELHMIAELCNVNYLWLKTGTGEMLRNAMPGAPIAATPAQHQLSHMDVTRDLAESDIEFVSHVGATKRPKDRPLPVFEIDAGYQHYYGDAGYEAGAAHRYTRRVRSNDDNAFCCAVYGDSMEPDYPRGSILLIEPSAPVRSGDDVIFCLGGKHETKSFKRYFALGDGREKFHPLNPQYQDVIAKKSEVKWKWKVTFVFREL